MDIFQELAKIDWWAACLAIVAAFLAFKFVFELFEWLVTKFGIETKSMREKREMKQLLKTTNELATTTNALAKKTDELAKKTAEGLNKLQIRHTSDEETFRNNLNNYMDESRKDRKALHDEMTKFTTNRQNDRAQSLKIQKELSDSIQAIAQKQDSRDEKIKDLTDMFVDKQIDDMRYKILDFAESVSSGKKFSTETYDHILQTYEKYEAILKQHGKKNGLVEESIKYVRKSYQDMLTNKEIL